MRTHQSSRKRLIAAPQKHNYFLQVRPGPSPMYLGISKKKGALLPEQGRLSVLLWNASPHCRRETHISPAAAGPFHIVVTLLMKDHWDRSLLHKAFHVCHRSGLFVMLNKNTFKPSTITASIGRIPESKENVKYKKSSASTHAQSSANFPNMAWLRSRWAPLTCAMLRPSDETLPVSCSSPCGISCVRRRRTCSGAPLTRVPTASPTDG